MATPRVRLSARQWIAAGLIVAGCLGFGLAVPFDFYVSHFDLPEEDGWISPEEEDLRMEMREMLSTGVEMIWSGWLRDLLQARSASEFAQGALPVFALLGSYALALPSIALYLLALRSGVFLWLGRAFWILLLAGPGLFAWLLIAMPGLPPELKERLTVSLKSGFLLWSAGVLLLAAAFWVLPVPGRRSRIEAPGIDQATRDESGN